MSFQCRVCRRWGLIPYTLEVQQVVIFLCLFQTSSFIFISLCQYLRCSFELQVSRMSDLWNSNDHYLLMGGIYFFWIAMSVCRSWHIDTSTTHVEMAGIIHHKTLLSTMSTQTCTHECGRLLIRDRLAKTKDCTIDIIASLLRRKQRLVGSE